jgi:O-acetyl-ADP-ribose deacetylase (regulator of RNase III)
MSHSEYKWQLGRITFHVTLGDLFAVPAQAIVNSEQTDFVLARNPNTISGQIHRRFGNEVQEQLDAQTNGETMPPGTVLRTHVDGSPVIFHAGFHHPFAWPDSSSKDDAESEHLQLIRSCVRQILSSMNDAGVNSVAFPLLGAGLFGLDPQVVAFGFFSEVLQFALQPSTHDQTVWLVLRETELFHRSVEAGIEAWIGQLPLAAKWEPLAIKVAYIDFFEDQLLRRVTHPQWAAWMHVRYAELVTGYMLFALASTTEGNLKPEAVAGKGRPLTFGTVRIEAARIAKHVASNGKHGWNSLFARIALQDDLIKRINDDRNDIAHGRTFRPVESIRTDIKSFLRIDEWRTHLEAFGLPPSSLAPWAVEPPETAMRQVGPAGSTTGVFEQWHPDSRRYLTPWNGLHFIVPV